MPTTQVNRPHMKPVVGLLQEVRRRRDEMVRTPTPEETFLVHDEGDCFWELLALRVRGYPAMLIGAARFQRQPSPRGVRHARRPLAMYLSTPPKELGLAKTARPANLLELLLPEMDEEIPAFQARIGSGGKGRTLYLDVETIEVAFDFRFENPSVEREQGVYHAPPEMHLFRTLEGHVLSGTAHGLHRRLHQGASFITMQQPLQHTPSGVQLLPPALVVHRSFVAVDGEVGEGESLSDWTANVAPFQAATALARYVLTPG